MEHYLASEFHRQQATRRAPAYQHLRRALQHAIENGELPNDMPLVGGMVRNICYANAKQYFALPE